ncbi:MAG: cation diffusion facilitator family transporter, partial [Candidatus Omnitrophota bacterium]
YEIGEKGAWVGILSNIALFILKFLAGIFGRSQAMIADAFHTASDALTSIAVLIGLKIARKPADLEHPYGHGRAESIAAKIVALVLIFVGLKLVHDSARILILKEMVKPHSIALYVAIVSIVVKELTYRRVILLSKKIRSTSLKADAYHHRSDVLSSVAALVGIAGARMGWTFLDPLAGILVAGFIIKVGTEVFHMAYDELMDAAPPKGLVRQIEETVMAAGGVLEVKKVMVRKYGLDLFLEITIGVDKNKTVQEGHSVTIEVEKCVCESIPNVEGVVVHVEPARGNS